MQDPYHLVLVDESQDLNRAQHRFLRECVVPADSPTVLCAVGDPLQAVYAFRGADPDSMERLSELFGAQRLRLTYCFRCPRRMTFLASQINPTIRASPKARVGELAIQVSGRPFETLVEIVEEKKTGRIVFLARGNAVLLEFLQYIYFLTDVPAVHWISPAVSRLVEGVVRDLGAAHMTVRAYLAHLRTAHAGSPVDRTLVHILETSIKIDGPSKYVSTSPFLAWIAGVLSPTAVHLPGARLMLATVHAVRASPSSPIQKNEGRSPRSSKVKSSSTSSSGSVSDAHAHTETKSGGAV